MKIEKLKKLVQKIVEQSYELKNKYTDEKNAPVNYACIFSQTEEEYLDLVETVKKFGKVVEKMQTGFLFQIGPLDTVSGTLKLLKIRIPDVTRPELGDSDFTVSNYTEFKKKNLSRKGFKLIKKREGFEMIELMDSKFNVRAYFSHPPLDEQLGIKLTFFSKKKVNQKQKAKFFVVSTPKNFTPFTLENYISIKTRSQALSFEIR